MKRKSATEKEFDRTFDALMKRLLDAGMIESHSKTRMPCIIWRADYQSSLGGRAAFVGLASLLADICREGPLSVEEQAMIQIVFQAEEEAPSSEA